MKSNFVPYQISRSHFSGLEFTGLSSPHDVRVGGQNSVDVAELLARIEKVEMKAEVLTEQLLVQMETAERLERLVVLKEKAELLALERTHEDLEGWMRCDISAVAAPETASLARKVLGYDPRRNAVRDRIPWYFNQDISDYAMELIGVIELGEKLLLEHDGKAMYDTTKGGSKVSITKDGTMLMHQIQNVPSRLEKDETLTTKTFVRDNLRQVVDLAYDSLFDAETHGRVTYVIGQPGMKNIPCIFFLIFFLFTGTGKTRAGLLWAQQKLLKDRHLFVRMNYKLGQMFLFLPKEDDSYAVFESCVSDFDSSYLNSSTRTIVLVDPPENPYAHTIAARSFIFCSNNDERHYHNASKDSEKIFLWTCQLIVTCIT